ncbi:PLD nuclease N-terminal domain-containing protein [Micromonospora sp. NBC_01796]|uniref:PLD nuclease N-terminal domain-containing protein n=1 Tax=Micromonospora sp. NBC_01796 TaxID=2975987 RepID=UPI002DDC3E54|nr:PLD nuclease N-terminal domain-containing protein [Micromonospora sp. NBC_01796]WSA87246.1 PLD nuclease N-terminal domain-containing protein [Micromonospora sp. NBC_01796]
MVRLMLFAFVAHVVLAAIALISCLSADKADIRALPRFLWVPIILVPLVGPIAWFLAGRPVPAAQRGTAGGRAPERRRPVAPDDNPEFLTSLADEQAKKDRELFERWEQDLRRREGEIRRRETDDPPVEEKRPEA